jgi:hypothetical protein
MLPFGFEHNRERAVEAKSTRFPPQFEEFKTG